MTERDRLAALLARIDGEWTQDTHGEGWYAFFATRLIAAGVTLAPAIDEERLDRALRGRVECTSSGAWYDISAIAKAYREDN